MAAENLERLRIDAGAKPSRKRGRLPVIIGIVAFVALAAALAMGRGPTKAELFTVQGSSADDNMILSATGYIIAKDPISVTPEVSGKVISVGPDAGESVAEGQLLIEIDSTFYRADYGAAEAARRELAVGLAPGENRARASRDEAKAVAMRAEEDHRRAISLFENGAISKAELDRAAADRAAAAARLTAAENDLALYAEGARRAQVAQAEHRAASSKASLSRTSIVSPISGVVIRREVTPGEYVIAGQGVGLRDMSSPPPYVVADMTKMEAVVEVSEREIARLGVGMHTLIRPDALPDSSFRGVVDRITPFAYRQKGVIELRVKLTEWSPLLKHEMNARIDFLSNPDAPARPALRIPASCVRSDDKGAYVLVAGDNGALARRDVTTAAAGGAEVIVEKGLSGGEKIAVDASLKEGTIVAIPAD